MKPQSSQQTAQNKGSCPLVSLCLQSSLSHIVYKKIEPIEPFQLRDRVVFASGMHFFTFDSTWKPCSDAGTCEALFLESALSRWNFVRTSKVENRTGRQVWTNCCPPTTTTAGRPHRNRPSLWACHSFLHTPNFCSICTFPAERWRESTEMKFEHAVLEITHILT